MANVLRFPTPRSSEARLSQAKDARQGQLLLEPESPRNERVHDMAHPLPPESRADMPRPMSRPISRALKVYGNPMLATTDSRQRVVLSGRLADVCSMLDGMADVAERIVRAG